MKSVMLLILLSLVVSCGKKNNKKSSTDGANIKPGQVSSQLEFMGSAVVTPDEESEIDMCIDYYTSNRTAFKDMMSQSDNPKIKNAYKENIRCTNKATAILECITSVRTTGDNVKMQEKIYFNGTDNDKQRAQMLCNFMQNGMSF